MPSLIQLQYALSVERHRHFSKASKECNVTQPTLSQQLQKLEDEIGIILFDRGKKPILPTPEGERFLEQAKVVLRENEKLLHISKQTKSHEVSGEFRLAVIPTVSSYLLPMVIRQFAKKYPKVQLFIEEMKTETILSELSNDKLDGAILATPISGSQYKTHPLYYEPFYVYFCSRHPLLKFNLVSRDQLNIMEMWLLQDGHCFKDQVLKYCAMPDSRRWTSQGNVRFQSGSLDTLKRLVQSSDGFTLIPAMMAFALSEKERTGHVRAFTPPVPTREISFIYRRDHWKLTIIKAIEETVLQNLPASIHRKLDKKQTLLDVC